MGAKIAIAGAGIYGTTAAIRLAESGHHVSLFDPLGILRAASAINQYRVHAGYHYPRSPETIRETLEVRDEFIAAFAPAMGGSRCEAKPPICSSSISLRRNIARRRGPRSCVVRRAGP